jgi:type 1 fimbria pilin
MASSKTALAKLKFQQTAAATRRRLKSNNLTNMIVRQGAGVATGVAIAVMNRNDVPAGMGGDGKGDKGVPWKPLLGGVALVGAALTKGSVSAAFEGVAIAANAIYAERAVTQGELVAGNI